MPEVATNGQNELDLDNGNKQQQKNEPVAAVTPAKRSHPESAEDGSVVKRAKSTAAPSVSGDDDVVFIDDMAGGGAIVIDDD